MVRLSPNGDRIAYRTVIKEEDYLLIKDLKSGAMIGGIIIRGINPSHAYFVGQDKIILIGSTYKMIQGFRRKHDVSSAFIYDITTKKLEQMLVPGRRIFRGQSGLGRVVGFSPDLKYAFMPAFVGKDGTTPRFNLMRVNLDKPRKLKTHKQGGQDTIDYFIDAEGNILARERYNNDSNIHSVEAFVNDDWVEIFSEVTEIMEKSFVGLTPDRKSLVMLASPDDEQNAYYAMSLKDGSISEPLFYRKDVSIEQILSDNQRVVYGVRYSGFKPDYAFFDKKMTQTYKAIQEVMPNNSFRIVDHTQDWQKIVFYVEGDGSSGNYLMLDEGQFHMLTAARPQIAGELVAPVRATSFEARDGLTIPTLLTYPLQNIQKPESLPTILMPHGGPESHDKIGFDWMAQYFANRGFLVIQPQFRGSSGFGYKFTRKGYGEWGKKMQDDLSDAVLHYADKGLVDKEKVCIVGWSYGGYAALAGAVFTPKLYRCVISINGVSDVDEMMKVEKRDYGKYHWVVSYWNKVIRDQNLGDDYLETISPVNYAEKVQAPVLLIHGEDDTVVRIDQSEDMASELDDADKTVTFLEIEDEGHSINNSNNSRLRVLTAIDKFLNKHMIDQN